MAKKESLRAYQDMILEKMQEARMSDDEQVDLLFGFEAAGMNFLISGKDIMQMASPTKLEPIPAAKPWAVGAANVKGSVYTVTDFSILMGHEPVKNGKFLLLSENVLPGYAILVDGLNSLYDLKVLGPSVDDAGMPGMPKFITSCHEIAGKRHYLIDTASLAVDTKFSILQSGENQ